MGAERPRCLFCNRRLRRYRWPDHERPSPWGDYGDGLFCGLRCGYRFALVLARAGDRIQRRGVPVDGSHDCAAEEIRPWGNR